MKIVSKYKDYYDAGLVYGIDEKLYFKREQSEERINTTFRWDGFELTSKEVKYSIILFPLVVWFCWEFHPFYRIQIEKEIWGKTDINQVYTYTYDDFIQVFIDIWCQLKNTKYKSYHHGASSKMKTTFKDALVFKDFELWISLSSIYDYLNNISNDYDRRGMKKDYKALKDIFQTRWVAYFIAGAYDFEIIERQHYSDIHWLNHIVTYPILKDYKFSQVKDAYTAFQEISMFLWNMNNPDDTMVKPDDKYVAYSKWFCSHSFKKRPTKSEEKPCDTKTSLE